MYEKGGWVGCCSKPEEYGKKQAARSNFKGKQMLTAPPREGKTNDVYFAKTHPWISDVSCLVYHSKSLAAPGHCEGEKIKLPAFTV